MSLKTRPLTGAKLRDFEAKRDLAAELLESVKQMKAGKTQVVLSPAVEARERTGLSQSQFAKLLGVSVRTLQQVAGHRPGFPISASLLENGVCPPVFLRRA